MPRIDRLCDLSADKSTSLADLRKFINVQPININERRPEYNTRAVDFAAQSGNFANFLFLAEEMQANMDVDPQLDVFNALQWAHYPNSSPEVKAYLTDPEKKPWLRFKDGMDGLHIAAYLGQCDVVENLLAENPDRVCELIQNRYTPLYWANLGKQVEMQTLLKHKLAAYAERYAAQDKKMLAYHFGMIMAAFGDHQDYPEFSEFLTLGKKMRAELKWLKVMYDYLRSIIRHGDIAFEQTKEEEKKLYAAAPNDTSVLIFEESLWPRSIRIIEQNLKAILELPETHKPEEMLVSERLSLLELYHRAASINWVLLNEERQKPEYNWDIIKRYLNKAYHYSELGLIISEQLSYSDLQSEDEAFQVELHDKLKSTLTSAEELERELQKENNTLTITYSPIKLFFNLLKRVDTTPQMVTEFLATNSISTTQRYHSRTFIEYAVCYSTTSIARLLIETNREALATAKHEHRLNLLDCLRDNKGISTSTREYILDPDTEIWKAFDDNTTELHVDAYAGRIDKVLKTLAENPDRINEINIFGEGIFFWAFYSDDSANFLAKLQQQSVLCLAPAANNNEWKKILTFFKSLEHFKESCSKKDKILEIYEFYTAWFATLELTDDGEIEEYEQLNDYLYADLTRLRLETDGESEKRFSLARLAAFKIIKPNKKDKLLNNILEAKIRFFIREAEKKIISSSNAIFDAKYESVVDFSLSAISSLEDAQKCLSEWQTNPADEKTFLEVVEKNLRTTAEQQLKQVYEILGWDASENVTPHEKSYSLSSASTLEDFPSSSISSSSSFSLHHTVDIDDQSSSKRIPQVDTVNQFGIFSDSSSSSSSRAKRKRSGSEDEDEADEKKEDMKVNNP